jgi:hypothetical protein
MIIDHRQIVDTMIVLAVFLLSCFLLGEMVGRTADRPSGVFLFGRRYYSRKMMRWAGHGGNHARRIMRKEWSTNDK